jgi:hypothetical protein
MDRWTFNPPKTRRLPALLALAGVAGLLGFFPAIDTAAAAESLGRCKVCREYNRACLQAHSKQACKSELGMCLKHCKQK